ncbi:MAG TPA: DUF5317 family protein [Candidatus Paceibacterota bacterium]|nr:DUF5317 family protein [Candidatus Paceibacterota bacterium]
MGIGFVAVFIAIVRHPGYPSGYMRRELGRLDFAVAVILAGLAWSTRLVSGLEPWFLPVFGVLTLVYGFTFVRARAPVCVVIAGIVCNVLVTSANGGRMPILTESDNPGYVRITDDTRLAWLGDVIPIHNFDLSHYGWCSAGDILLCIGSWMLAVGIWRSGRRSPRE